MTETPANEQPKGKRPLRVVIERVALWLLVLALLEGALRLAGLGGRPPVLREVGTRDGVTLVRVDQEGVARFFDIGAGGSVRHGLFTMPKPPDTVRIFTLGASAMYGFPQERHLCAVAFLEAMLADVWPDRDVEIINLGTVGIASFPVMSLSDQVFAYDPDLVIVWTGNNEFYGSYGVASAQGVGTSTRMMHLRHALAGTAIADAVFAAIGFIRGGAESRSLLDRMTAVPSIGPDDPRRATAARNLEQHLTHMVQRCVEHGVSSMLCTLPANERDMAPLGVVTTLPLSRPERDAFERHFTRAKELLPDDATAALDALRSANDVYAEHALVHYLTGRCLTRLGRHGEAAAAYDRARDLDPMPWRAPSPSGDAVRRAAAGGAMLCDLERVFRDASPGGSIGWELLDDQVHPNLRGQDLVARAMLHALSEAEDPSIRVDPAAIAALPAPETYFARLDANPYDAYVALDAVKQLFGSDIFEGTRASALDHTRESMERVEARLAPWEADAVRGWIDERAGGWNQPVTVAVAAAAEARGDLEKATRLMLVGQKTVGETHPLYLVYGFSALRIAARIDPEPSAELIAVANRIIASGELQIAAGDDAPTIRIHLGLTYKYLGRENEAIECLVPCLDDLREPGQLFIVNALVDSLVKTGQKERARDVLQREYPNPELTAACRRLLQRLD